MKSGASVVLAVAFMFVGCGPAPINPEAMGNWWGLASWEASDGTVATASLTIQVRDVDGQVELSGVCPADAGGVVVDEAGNTASWKGEMTCPTSMDATCPLIFTYRALTLEYAGGALFVDGTGDGGSCSSAATFVMSFVGLQL